MSKVVGVVPGVPKQGAISTTSAPWEQQSLEQLEFYRVIDSLAVAS